VRSFSLMPTGQKRTCPSFVGVLFPGPCRRDCCLIPLRESSSERPRRPSMLRSNCRCVTPPRPWRPNPSASSSFPLLPPLPATPTTLTPPAATTAATVPPHPLRGARSPKSMPATSRRVTTFSLSAAIPGASFWPSLLPGTRAIRSSLTLTAAGSSYCRWHRPGTPIGLDTLLELPQKCVESESTYAAEYCHFRRHDRRCANIHFRLVCFRRLVLDLE